MSAGEVFSWMICKFLLVSSFIENVVFVVVSFIVFQ